MNLKTISVTSLLLDSRNPRVEEGEDSQREVIRAIAFQQKDKLIRLADDIVKNGLNAAELPIVIPHPEHERRYVVLEGNRRIAALKLLLQPDIITDAVAPKIERAFRRRSDEYRFNPIRQITCAVAAGRKEADHWIELRHTGENQGAGLVPWGAAETARFSARRGRHSPELEVIEFVKEHGNLSQEVRGNLTRMAITNLGRLLSDREVRNRLGVEKEKGHIFTRLPREEVLKGLRRIVTDIALKKITVYTIDTKSDRRKYLKRFGSDELPDLTRAEPDVVPLENAPAPGRRRKSERGKKKKSTPVRRARSTLIPERFALAIPHSRINDILHELKQLAVTTYPNASAVLFRVFLELSLDDFIDRLGMSEEYNLSDESALRHKLNQVARYLEDQGLMTKSQLQPVRRASSHRFLGTGITSFNEFVHNRYLTPEPDTLKTAWDNLQQFFEVLWQQ